MSIFLKKAWAWIKSYWFVPVIIVLIMLFAFIRGSIKSRLYEVIEKQREAHKKEIDLINSAEKEKQEKKAEVRKKHEEALTKIKEEYNIKLEKLEEDKKKEINEAVEEYRDKPDDLAREIARILSAEYMKREWEEKN